MIEEFTKKAFPFFKNEDFKTYRLICFHHAGGTVLVFKNWLAADPMVEVLPIEIDRKSIRNKETGEIDFNLATDYAAENIARIYDFRPTFVYGHSLGSLLAFDTVYKLEKKYGIKIEKLFVAGRHAPFAEDPSTFRCSMGIEALKKELLQLGGTSSEVLQDAAFCKYLLPNIFEDYQLNECYRYEGQKLDIPIVILSGNNDFGAGKDIMSEWKQCTKNSSSAYTFDGGHFFPYEESKSEVLAVIMNEIYKNEGISKVAEF